MTAVTLLYDNLYCTIRESYDSVYITADTTVGHAVLLIPLSDLLSDILSY